ncbi:hemolysin [Jeotgalicoccus coquinae]|uniref:Hemolysin C n=1 Tax=Jeotgalicoccus coquinae TaxID=709509 RepID=A0A6V7RP41_9STAP|nr:CNNM domain-containing protein [Jeotgalicoccus coquinae]MBB6423997.1 Mg2+/Co2+ transporter CorB [Jeotgalicoccus coquinae]GGE23317.1 hemolysin [Jeotgalicoccus coquinae]CAD2080137.1 Hemolysin C [Jeotgalicoccus coquinae]
MIFVVILLLFGSFFFSGSETALTAVNKIKLQSKAAGGDQRAEKLYNLVSKPSQFITTILIGNNIANLVAPVLVTSMAIEYGWSVTIASVVLTITIIIFSEIIPKSIAAAFPERISYLVRPIIAFLNIIFYPLTVVLNKMTDVITGYLSKGSQPSWTVSREEIVNLVQIADSEGAIEGVESQRLKGILDFRDLNVKDVMTTPRTEMVAVHVDDSFETVRDRIIDEMHTRYPVYDEDLDNIVGVFHSKYLLQWSLNPTEPLMNYCDNNPFTVREFQSVEDVLRRMSKQRRHLAIVLDEYGGTEGVLTHEDIIETMLGFEIEDETDLKNDSVVRAFSEDKILCDGKITLHRLNQLFNTEIPQDEDTLSGFLLSVFEEVPSENDIAHLNNLEFKVIEMEDNMIRLVKITKLDAELMQGE